MEITDWVCCYDMMVALIPLRRRPPVCGQGLVLLNKQWRSDVRRPIVDHPCHSKEDMKQDRQWKEMILGYGVG